MKKIILTFLSVLLVLGVGVGISEVALGAKTSANTEQFVQTEFKMEEGASFRSYWTLPNCGITYGAVMQTDNENYNKVRLFLAPYDFVQSVRGNRTEELDYVQEFINAGKTYKSVIPQVKTAENGVINFRAGVKDIAYGNLNRPFFGIYYYEDGGVRTYAKMPNGEAGQARSMAYVSSAYYTIATDENDVNVTTHFVDKSIKNAVERTGNSVSGTVDQNKLDITVSAISYLDDKLSYTLKYDGIDITAKSDLFLKWDNSLDGIELLNNKILSLSKLTSGKITVQIAKFIKTIDLSVKKINETPSKVELVDNLYVNDITNVQQQLKVTYSVGGNRLTEKTLIIDASSIVNNGDGSAKLSVSNDFVENVTNNFDITFTLNYNTYGGTINEEYLTEYRVDFNDFDLPTNVTKTGYTFTEWQESGTPISKIVKGTTGDKILDAIYNANEYKINYELNGGTLASGSPTSYVYGSGATLLNPSKQGFNFGGWYENAQFSGSAVTSVSETATGEKTFYAKWDIQTFTLSIPFADSNVNKGYLQVNSEAKGAEGVAARLDGVPYGTTISISGDNNAKVMTLTGSATYGQGSYKATITLTPATLEGYTSSIRFATSTASSDNNVPEGLIIDGDTTLYARASRTVNKYTVTINTSGAGSVNTTSIENVPYGTVINSNENKLTINGTTVSATVGSKDGYTVTWGGWSISNGAQITGNTTITAKFNESVNYYTLSFGVNNGNYGKWNSTATMSVAYGTSITSSGQTVTVSGVGSRTASVIDTEGHTTKFTNFTNVKSMPASDMTITANFSRSVNYYTLSFGVNNGNYGKWNSTATMSVAYGTSITSSGSTVTVSGVGSRTASTYDANGYTTKLDGFTNVKSMPASNMTITANFSRTAHSYSITYEYNSGVIGQQDVPSSVTHSYNKPTSVSYGSLVTVGAPTVSGYTFMGWKVFNYNSDTAYYGESSSAVNRDIESDRMLCYAASGFKMNGTVYFINLTPTSGGSVKLQAWWAKDNDIKAGSSNYTNANGHDNIDYNLRYSNYRGLEGLSGDFDIVINAYQDMGPNVTSGWALDDVRYRGTFLEINSSGNDWTNYGSLLRWDNFEGKTSRAGASILGGTRVRSNAAGEFTNSSYASLFRKAWVYYEISGRDVGFRSGYIEVKAMVTCANTDTKYYFTERLNAPNVFYNKNNDLNWTIDICVTGAYVDYGVLYTSVTKPSTYNGQSDVWKDLNGGNYYNEFCNTTGYSYSGTAGGGTSGGFQGWLTGNFDVTVEYDGWQSTEGEATTAYYYTPTIILWKGNYTEGEYHDCKTDWFWGHGGSFFVEADWRTPNLTEWENASTGMYYSSDSAAATTKARAHYKAVITRTGTQLILKYTITGGGVTWYSYHKISLADGTTGISIDIANNMTHINHITIVHN